MPLPLPKLDDRTFQQLVDEARRQVAQSAPEWTDLSPGDPGIVLLEAFAFLTETMLYRLNRLPEKAYVAFLRLLGVTLEPPSAAAVSLHFTRAQDSSQPLQIPRSTRVSLKRADGGREPPTFITSRTVTMAAGESAVDVLAHHCEQVTGELAGRATGLPALSVAARRPPIIAPTGDELDLVAGIEARAGELTPSEPAIEYEGKTYRIWREVENFTNLGADRFVYIADRNTGTITFAPAARRRNEAGDLSEATEGLAAVPAADREIRLWYRRGGGPDGNVAANSLTVIKDTLAGVQVTNPSAATGGRAGETLSNALVRGPQEFHSLERAITAQDFELIAKKRSPAIARAHAFTRAALWMFATPGTVEVLLVPYLSEQLQPQGRVTIDALRAQETDDARLQIQNALEERRPLGTNVLVNWAHYKLVSVKARIVVRREEDYERVRQRVLLRLHQIINPLPNALSAEGWPFGQALRASNVYDIALSEPGVRWVDRVRLRVDEVPSTMVSSLAVDAFQPHTWYAASGATLFRTINDGDGWEPAGRFANEQVDLVRVHPNLPGLAAIATHAANVQGSRVRFSLDSGETWLPDSFPISVAIYDLAWAVRDGVPLLLLATDGGLFELPLRSGSTPVQVLVDPRKQNLGFYAVTVATEARGAYSIAVAAEGTAGVYLSSEGGRANTFRKIDEMGVKGEDIRVLTVQYVGPNTYLWAGAFSPGGDDPGHGCFRWQLLGQQNPPEGWVRFGEGWDGGSCRAIAFQGTKVFAGTHRRGVVWLDARGGSVPWVKPDVNSGLPLRDQGRFQIVGSVACDPNAQWVMASGANGVFRSRDSGVNYQPYSANEFPEAVTIPNSWLFVSGEHDLSVISEDEAR